MKYPLEATGMGRTILGEPQDGPQDARKGHSRMSESSSHSSGGIGFAGLLTVLFIGLKLTGHIDWSWWWVLSPLWIAFAVSGLILLLFLAIAAAGGAFR